MNSHYSSQHQSQEIHKRINGNLTSNEELLYRTNMFISGRYIEMKMKKIQHRVAMEKKLDILRDERKKIICPK